jgi:hypothetical protein
LLTHNAVYSIVNSLNNLLPAVGEFLISRVDTIAFIHAFAWIFVLSSVIPTIILGKGRSILLQFFLCLTIAFVAVSIEGVLTVMMGTEPTTQMQALSPWFQNPVVAGLYLSMPYLFMLYLDLRSRNKGVKEDSSASVEAAYLKDSTRQEKDVTDDVANINSETRNGASKRSGPGRVNFLHGASVACFILAFVILWLGETSSTILPIFDELIYVTIFVALGVTLLGLGFYLTEVQKQALTSQETAELPPILAEEEVSRAPELSTDSSEASAEEMIPPVESEASAEEMIPPVESEASAEEMIPPVDSLVHAQILDQPCEVQVEKYDVTRPKHVVDSQC